MEDYNGICKNCESPLSGAYCQNCGQRAAVKRITVKDTFNDLIAAIFSVDAPFFITLKYLFINPGRLFREYLTGKRKTYYKPVAFFLVTTIVYLLIRSLINYDPFSNTTINVVDETQSQLLTEARNYMLLNIDKLLFVFVFLLGLLLKLFFFKRHTFAEYLAVSFFLCGIYAVFTTINLLYIKYINANFQFLAMFVMCAYFIYAMISFFKKGRVWVVLKSVILFFMAFISYGLSAFAISYLIVWFKNS